MCSGSHQMSPVTKSPLSGDLCPILPSPHFFAHCMSRLYILLILDASAADRLPPGVSGNHLPSWLLPSMPSSTLSLLRPDMLVIHGLSLSSSRLMTAQLTAHDPTTLALLKASYNEKRLKVTIVAQTNLSKRVTLSTLVQQVRRD